MSSTPEIRRVHKLESKFKLRPHLVVDEPAVFLDGKPLRVTLRDLISPKAYQQLKELGLIP